MTLQDFLESLSSNLLRWAGEQGSIPSALQFGSKAQVVDAQERAPLFVLGKWDEIIEQIKDLKLDLIEDLADGLMVPFPSIVVAFEGKRGWTMEWLHRRAEDCYLHVAFFESQDTAWFQNTIEFDFRGKRDGSFWVELAPESVNRYLKVDARAPEAVAQDMGRVIEDALLRVALISHPENYVVKRTPLLTPREKRQVAQHKPVPARKRPYYVVLDHHALVKLRQESTSTALKLPLPHARRGHWMRLAKRCRSARLLGRDRVWRRETCVGDREFEDGSAKFEVFLSAREAAKVDCPAIG